MAKKARISRVRLISYGFMLINTVTWGAALIIVKPSLDFTTPYRFLLYRYAIAGLVGLPILVYYLKNNKKLLKAIPKIASVELIGTTLALWLLYAGLQRTGAIEASLLYSAQPLFIALGGFALLRETIERNERAGLALAFVGTIILALLPVIHGNGSLEGISLYGNVLVLASIMLNMFYFPLAKKHYTKLPKIFASTVSFYLGLVSFFILSLYEMRFSLPALTSVIRAEAANTTIMFAAFYMAVFGSIIGYTAYLKGQDGIEASEASLFYYLQPLIYLPLGVILLGESVVALQIFALILIVSGVMLAEYRFKKSH